MAFAMSIGEETTDASSCSLLPRAEEGEKVSLRSIGLPWRTELEMDDDRVEDILREADRDGILDGVSLREDLPSVDALLRSRTLRVSTGNRVSILFVMLCADDSADRRRFGKCDTESPLR